MPNCFWWANSLCNNFVNIKNTEDLDSRRHLLDFFPTASLARVFFSRFCCTGILFWKLSNSLSLSQNTKKKKKKGSPLTIRSLYLHCSAVRTLLTSIIAFPSLRIVPESPRWAFLNSSTKDGTNEAQGLLERLVNEEQRQSSKYRNCLTMWGHFHFPAEAKTRGRCFTFLRRKKQRKITIVLGVAW